MKQAQDNLGKSATHGAGDAGFSSIKHIKPAVEMGLDVIVPTQKQAHHQPTEDPFSKDKFIYDEQNDHYICPNGKALTYSSSEKKRDRSIYRINDKNHCKQCPLNTDKQCTKNFRGRSVVRLGDEVLVEQLAARYESSSGQEIYAKRKSKVELPFGHIKHNLKCQSFLMRGVQGAKAEWSILASCFNITRAINLLGGTIKAINEIKQCTTV